ncbi:MAG: AI-2E family transporter [Bacteroidetes bacterium]|jgi:AI-2 transport protein TqsA|nr:AI-2E family transporter [Bacteroidota bacterium]MBT3750073.1 AI-2E family transporter [Bacteroidota bacterium]MBT4401259.1 AI-2E family transporter [Bacteroidota bacterium]MBT4408254.1 AI-2E family transporter [Bacteroidota bacterium]MBT5427118.1 AI-2E family transporter [Bacteroidota bacterium]
MNSSKKILVLLMAVISVLILIYAKKIIIPFILAILFWFIIRAIKKGILKLKFMKKIPIWLITIFSTLLLLSILVLMVGMISKNIQQLSEAMPEYEENINILTEQLNDTFNIDLAETIKDYTEEINFGNILSDLFSALTGLFGNAFMILLYLVFLLLEEPTFRRKLRRMYPSDDRYKQIEGLVSKIDMSIRSYITLKSLVSILTGFLSYFALLFIGVDAPLFWAFLIFILNFIPTIGSLIATIFPAVFSMLQFGELSPAILVLSIVGAIQLLVGNLIEPKLMGTSLNISPLVVFLTLALWGLIWGITGMLLSVPITVILIIILSEFKDTKPIAILLSQKGNVGQ